MDIISKPLIWHYLSDWSRCDRDCGCFYEDHSNNP